MDLLRTSKNACVEEEDTYHSQSQKPPPLNEKVSEVAAGEK
jgi:hypothetical protein